METELYKCLQTTYGGNSHEKCVKYCTDFYTHAHSTELAALPDAQYDEIAEAADAFGNIKLAQFTDWVEELDSWYAKQRVAVGAADALNVRRVG